MSPGDPVVPDPERPPLRPASQVVHLGRPGRRPGGELNPAIHLSSTYHQGGQVGYARESNSTWEALEEAVGGLEGGRAVSFASGLAAVSAVVEMLPVPAFVVADAGCYSGTRRLLGDLAARGRLRLRLVDCTNAPAALAAAEELTGSPGRPWGPQSGFGSGGLLWLESPTNPALGLADLATLSAGAHRLGLAVAVDNTFATPLLQRPLDLGADVVVHSATKSLSGHSDALLGVAVSRSPEILEALRLKRTLQGAIPGPFEAWLVLRGIRTLHLRLERSQASALELARRLERHPGVSRVLYPGLPTHPGHHLASTQMRGFGSMISFVCLGGAEAAEALERSVRLISAATSLGGVESLIERRARWPGEEQVPPGLLRLSVGVEDLEDIWGDLSAALEAYRA